jgi:hypothetical protein
MADFQIISRQEVAGTEMASQMSLIKAVNLKSPTVDTCVTPNTIV